MVTLCKSVFAGILIGMAAIISANATYPHIIFTIGLISVIYCDGYLYTGMIGKMSPSNYRMISTILIGNLIGVLIMCGYAIHFCDLAMWSTAIINRQNYSLGYVFVSSIFCGVLMCVATILNKKRNILIMILCVSGFILGKFPHCIADTFYLSLNGISLRDIFYILISVVGNTTGAKIAYICAGGNKE